MSTKTKSAIPTIEEIKLSELIVDNSLSGRTDKEISANAKEKAVLLDAFGGWDAKQPGQYFKRDGKKHLAAGFSRVCAAIGLGLKVGYFIEVLDDASQLRTACIRTNTGKPISANEQGRIYAAMRAGSDPATLAVGEVALPPMKEAEIAKELGVSRQWVDNCIAVFEAPAEIGELILGGKLSPNVFNRVRQIAKTLPAQIKIINAATKAAEGEGKETVTMKHFDAIKSQFIEPKKLKATIGAQPELPANNAPESTPEPSIDAARDNTADDEPAPVVEDNTKPAKATPAAPIQTLADLGGDSETVHKKKLEKYRKQVVEAIAGWDADGQVAFEDSQIESLADAICKIAVPF